jgi:3-methyladenine DNA glycosylase AlkD
MKRGAASKALIEAARAELEAAGDPARAPGMQAYMKSAMPYRGVSAVPLRAICKRLFAGHPLPSEAEWRSAVLGLWRDAKYREERYVAVELTGFKAYREHQTMDALPLYEELIVSGAWWDYVDPIASHRLGGLLRDHATPMRKVMRAWSRDADMWKRRSSILCQLTFKEHTDLEFLYACIAPSLGSKEFFLRKAIGWALRQYAWTDPAEIVRYVREHESELSGLSKREALKNVTTV